VRSVLWVIGAPLYRIAALPDRPWFERGYPWFLLAGAASSLAVFGVRFSSVLQVRGLEPTSGLEGGGAFGIYRLCTNQPIYHDFSQLPNGFIYNFLFYDIYGYIVRVFGPCDATPLIGRFITLSLLVVTAVLIWIASRPALMRVEAGVIALALFSPVIGWWAFALRPDIGGMTFLVAALLCCVYYLNNQNFLMVVLSGSCLVCAWGFKQPYVFAAPAMLLYTFSRNRIHAVVLLLVFAAGLCSPLLMFEGKQYLLHTVQIASALSISSLLVLTNAIAFLWKALGVLIPAALIGCMTMRRELLLSATNFLVVILIFSFGLFAVLGGRSGAADYYLFPTFVAGILLIAIGSARLPKFARRLLFLTFTIITFIQSWVILTGIRGNMELPKDSINAALSLSAALAELPGPKMVWDNILGLPWFTPNVETRILDASIDITGGSRIPGAINPTSLLAEGYYGAAAIPAHMRGSIDYSKYYVKTTIGPLVVFGRRDEGTR